MDCVQVAGLKVAIYSGRQGEKMTVREARKGARARGREREYGVLVLDAGVFKESES